MNPNPKDQAKENNSVPARAAHGHARDFKYVPAEVSLPAPLSSVVADLWLPSVREAVGGLFEELTGLLNHLRVINALMSEDETLARTPLIFELIRKRAYAFLASLKSQLPRVRAYDAAVADALDGTCFALAHELRRVYGEESFLSRADQAAERLRADATRAHGLLTNCFQQSVIAVARLFDPRVSGPALFSDYKERLEQSLRLHEELAVLVAFAQEAEAKPAEPSYVALVVALEYFRERFLHQLMYRDWAEFEGFVERIAAARDAAARAAVLHQFARYAETLILHVRMRAVLTEHGPARDDCHAAPADFWA